MYEQMKNNVYTKDLVYTDLYTADEAGEHLVVAGEAVRLSATTTDATPTIMTVDSGSVIATSGEAVAYEGLVIGRDATNNEVAVYKIKGVIKNIAGTTAEVVAGETEELIVKEDLTWAIDAQANDTSDTLELQVTGDAANTVEWTAILTLVRA